MAIEQIISNYLSKSYPELLQLYSLKFKLKSGIET